MRFAHDALAANSIAIIGAVGSFPGARSVENLWKNVRHGVDSITQFSRDELLTAGVAPATLDDPAYVRAAGVIDGIEYFDAEFFGFSPRDAESLEPQHRLFMEFAWQALERAGYSGDHVRERVGVFAGAAHSSYTSSGGSIVLDNEKDHLATRVAYKLNLRGPALTVQTTCSTSLVAVCTAIESLRCGSCDIALAGGISLRLPTSRGYFYRQGDILSPDGRCRSFDAAARGTVFSSGLGIVVLKRLEEAVRDGDSIVATIRGSAVNNDGALKVGYTAPSIQGQADVIGRALDAAGVDASEVGYVEAHGTGTELGDPIEVAALTDAFRSSTPRTVYCAIGSVKTNIGHLNTAAGVAGLIKAAMSVKDGWIAPSLHFERPNPNIDFASTPFYVGTALTRWPKEFATRVAGVSSFGIGGTNAHVVVEQPPPADEARPARLWHVLPLSARTETAFVGVAENVRQTIVEGDANLADVAFTLQVGRKSMSWRRASLCRDGIDAALELGAAAEPVRASPGCKVAFLFPGQGSQSIGSTATLYASESVFRSSMDRCAEAFRTHLGFDLRDVVYGPPERAGERPGEIYQTSVAQPLIFSIGYSLASLWMSLGIEPSAMLGHSIGEYVAACIAGVFTLDDAIAVVAKRCSLMQSLPGGSMTAVALAAERCEELLRSRFPDLSVAAENAPGASVVSGPTAAVEALRAHLASSGVATHALRTSHAFHSEMMTPVLDELARFIEGIELSAPRIPFVSNRKGEWITASDARSAQYWAQHVREAVRFSDGITTLANSGAAVLLEMGPGRVLSGLAKEQIAESGPIVISTMPHVRDGGDEGHALALAAAELWELGAPVRWDRYAAELPQRRIPLPAYPFERNRYWMDTSPPKPTKGRAAPAERASLDESFYVLTWKRVARLASAPVRELAQRSATWLVLSNGSPVTAAVRERLAELGQQCVVVTKGEDFTAAARGEYTASFTDPGSLAAVARSLHDDGGVIDHVLDLTAMGTLAEPGAAPDFFVLIHLMQAFSALGTSPRFDLTVASTGMQDVIGLEAVDAAKALWLGPLWVIPQEFATVSARCVDFEAARAESKPAETAELIIAEAAAWTRDGLVAYRAGQRWVQESESIALAGDENESLLRRDGVYVITGGSGGIGLALMSWLAKRYGAKVALVSRRAFPPRDEWTARIDSGSDPLAGAMTAILRAEVDGGEVHVVSADVTDRESLRSAVESVRRRWGRIDGAVHAAGIAGGGVIELKTADAASRVMAPKVDGVRYLLDALSGGPVAFVVLCSSIEAVRGTSGQIDYAAANAYLDGVARQHRAAASGPRIISIDWGTWREIGMAVDTPVPEAERAERDAVLRRGLTTAEGVEAFRRILASSHTQVIVSPAGYVLPTALKQARAEAKREIAASNEAKSPQRRLHPRPRLDSPYVPLSGAVEEQLAKIWEGLLGIADIGALDNFFALGGHSLMAVRLTFSVRTEFDVEYSLQDLFDAPTIRQTGDTLLVRYASSTDAAELQAMLASIDAMSPAEVAQALGDDHAHA